MVYLVTVDEAVNVAVLILLFSGSHLTSICVCLNGVFALIYFSLFPYEYTTKDFTDHFEEMIYLQHPRDSVIENVGKMINCGNPAFGGAMYTCPCCGNFKFVPFAVIPASVLPAATCTPLTGLLLCLLNSLMSSTATASLQLQENYVLFSTGPFSFKLPFFFCRQRYYTHVP